MTEQKFQNTDTHSASIKNTESVSLNEEIKKSENTKISKKDDQLLDYYTNLSPKQIKKLKTLSIIVSIFAGIGSTAYYLYSIVVGDTMILRPADTIIIQDGDLKFDEGGGTQEATEQSVVERLIESKKTEKDFIPIDYYVGKILDVSIPEIPTENPSMFPSDPRKAGLILKIKKLTILPAKNALKTRLTVR